MIQARQYTFLVYSLFRTVSILVKISKTGSLPTHSMNFPRRTQIQQNKNQTGYGPDKSGDVVSYLFQDNDYVQCDPIPSGFSKHKV